MENIYQYFDKHGFYAFIFYVWCIPIASWLFVSIMDRILLTIRRICRTINIVLRGWPPPRLDADGDSVKDLNKDI